MGHYANLHDKNSQKVIALNKATKTEDENGKAEYQPAVSSNLILLKKQYDAKTAT